MDANAEGLSLQVSAACGGTCDARQDVPLTVHASRGGAIVHVTVVRSPHVYAGDAADGSSWTTVAWYDASVRTDDAGNAAVAIPHPNDDLASTYGVHVESGGAAADTRVSVPTAQAAVRLTVDRAQQGPGNPVGFDVYATALDGKPLAGASATVDMVHGASVARQQLQLDANGHARGTFRSADLGTNFLFAYVDRGGRAMDAAQVRVDPQSSQASSDGGSPNVRVTLDKGSYRAGDEVSVSAAAPGARGSALITYESALGIEPRVVRTSGGAASARLHAVNAAGDLRVGAAFVRDGAVEWTSVPLSLAGPGRPHPASLTLAGADFAPGDTAKVGLEGAQGPGTFVVRVSRGVPSGSALFDSAPSLLAIGVSSDAEQRRRHGDLASVGQLDRRTRAGARLRSPVRTAAGALAGAGRDRRRLVERGPRAGSARRAAPGPQRTLRAFGAGDRRRRERQRRLHDRRRSVAEAGYEDRWH